MARAIRVLYEGAWYHVMTRGYRREAIFLNVMRVEIELWIFEQRRF